MYNKRILILVTSAFTILTSCSQEGKVEEQVKETKFHIPTTVSKEAQRIIGEWSLEGRNKGVNNFLEADAPIADWEAKQEEFNEMASKSMPELLEFYKPTVDTIEVGGIRAIDVKPKGYVESDKVVVYIHGGGYVLFTADVTMLSSVPLADASGLRVITIDYTLSPQAKFGKITDEVLQFYKGLLKMGYNPKNISIYGDSAGGGLAAGSILKMRDNGIELPSSLVLWSPWADIDEVGDTYFTLKDNDPNLVNKGFLEECALAYADKKDFKNPYVSPVYGDFSKDFPPTLIQVGGKEIFLSNSIRMYRALNEAGKEVKLDVYEGMWHVWQGYYKIPESKMAVNNTKKFILEHFKSE